MKVTQSKVKHAQRFRLTIRATVLYTVQNKAGFHCHQTKGGRGTKIDAPGFYLHQVDGCAEEYCYRIAGDQKLARLVVMTRGQQDRREDMDIKKALTGHTH